MPINNPHLVERLIKIGFGEREAKVYIGLLNRRSATAYEIQRFSNVPMSKVYATINKLVYKGYFKERKEGRKRILEIISPETSLTSHINQLETQVKIAKDLRDELEDIFSNSQKQLEPFEYIEIIHGNDNIHRKYLELMRTAKFELLGFTLPPFVCMSKEMLKEQVDTYHAFIRRGGSFRGVYEVHEDSPPKMFYLISDSIQHGENFRILPKLPLKMFIFDRQTLLITEKSFLSQEDELSQTVIKQKTTVDGYITLFDFLWEQGIEYEQWLKDKEQLVERKLAEFERSFT